MSRLLVEEANDEAHIEQPRSSERNAIEEDEVDVESEVDSEPEKDATEEELERVVFGDSAGFREGLGNWALEEEEEEEEEEESEGNDTSGLEGLDNADVGQALKT